MSPVRLPDETDKQWFTRLKFHWQAVSTLLLKYGIQQHDSKFIFAQHQVKIAERELNV